MAMLAISPTPSPAATPRDGLPTNICADGGCNEQHQDLWRRFQEAAPLTSEKIQGVFAGECYYRSRMAPADEPQFAGIYLRPDGEDLIFGGRFGFNLVENTYLTVTEEEANDFFPQRFQVKLEDDFAYVDASQPATPFHYWLRQDPDSDGLILISYFGWKNVFFCRMEKNEEQP